MSAQHGERPWPLIAFYFLHFMTVGVALPFLPGYFEAMGLSATEAGALLAVGPTFAIVLPPLWGQLADRLGRAGLVLLVTTSGATVGYGLLAAADGFWSSLGALAVHATFATGIVSLVDALALQHVQTQGGDYARLRVWGSIGFITAALPFGFVFERVGLEAVMLALGLTGLSAALCAATLARKPRERSTGPRPTIREGLALLARRDVRWFLAATALHWVACTPYHGSMAPHVKALGLSPWVVSVSFSVGVIAEIVVMRTWPRWASRFAPRVLLAASFLLSSVRWALMAVTSSAAALSLIAPLHAFTFGAFYLAAVGWMSQTVPASLRATGQALLSAVTFGVGGVIGFRASGFVYGALGGHRLFGMAAALELGATALVLVALRPAMPADGAPPRVTGRGR